MSRRSARVVAVQYVYAWSYGYRDSAESFINYVGKPTKKGDKLMCLDLINGTIDSLPAIDRIIAKKFTGNFDSITEIDKAILRVGIAELVLINRDMPAVVINEYLEITDEYSSSLSKGMINAILDGVKNDLQGL